MNFAMTNRRMTNATSGGLTPIIPTYAVYADPFRGTATYQPNPFGGTVVTTGVNPDPFAGTVQYKGAT